ncbi:MAG: DNA-binding protein [Clostridia bacterium]
MNKTQDKLQTIMLFDIYGKLLTEKQANMLNLFYNYDNSLAELAEQYNISRQGAYDFVTTAEQQLLNYEHKLGLLEKYDLIKQTVTNIKDNLSGEEVYLQQQILQQLQILTNIVGGE